MDRNEEVIGYVRYAPLVDGGVRIEVRQCPHIESHRQSRHYATAKVLWQEPLPLIRAIEALTTAQRNPLRYVPNLFSD